MNGGLLANKYMDILVAGIIKFYGEQQHFSLFPFYVRSPSRVDDFYFFDCSGPF